MHSITNKIVLIPFALGLLCPSVVAAARSLSLREAVELALRHNQDIQISAESMDKMRNKYREVRSMALPQLSGNVAWNRYIKSPVLTVDFGDGTQDFKIKQKYEGIAGATLTQVVWAFGKVSLAIELAQDAFELERLSKAATVSEVRFLTKKLYYTILYARQALAIAEQSQDNVLKNDRALKNRFQGGRVSRIDNIKMEADVAGRASPVLEARSRCELLMEDFRNLTGIKASEEIVIADDFIREFPRYDADSLSADMRLREPALQALRQSIMFNAKAARVKKKDYFPVLSAYAGYDYSGNGPEVIPWDQMRSTVVTGLNLSVPIWDSGRISGAFRQAEADTQIARLSYEKRLDDMAAALNSALEDYASLQKVYAADGKALALARESYRITLDSFASGAASLIQLNDAERQLTLTELQALATLYAINIRIAEIEKLTQGEAP